MKKALAIILATFLLLSLAACGSNATPTSSSAPAPAASGGPETLTGKGDGFGGVITVTITRENGKITDVKIDAPDETAGIAAPAVEQLPAAIVSANGAGVDVVSGATVTSKGIIYAVNNALDPAAFPHPIATEAAPAAEPSAMTAASVYQGFGLDNSARIGPGKDDKDVQVYSVNQVMANVLFDGDGKILALNIDQIEYATPNYDGDGMPHFSGFPGQGGYNWDSDHDEKVDSKTEDTEDNFKAEVASWSTKRDRGDSYKMGAGTWSSQMDKFQTIFVGMTVNEVEDWFKKYTSDINGRPLKGDSSNAEDVTKFEALSEDEQKMLVDVVSGATMSLNDSHGDIVAAIRSSLTRKTNVDLTIG